MTSLIEEKVLEPVKGPNADEVRSTKKRKCRLSRLMHYELIRSATAAVSQSVRGALGMILTCGNLRLVLNNKILAVPIAANWNFLKAVGRSVDGPRAYILEREKHPRVFEEIDRLATALKTVKIHQVILDGHLNAAVIQRTHSGIHGGRGTTLILGLQLLLALSPEEMQVVLAHELGHLAGNQRPFSGWIGRVRQAWVQAVAAGDAKPALAARLLQRFILGCAPTATVDSLALVRNNEYAADQVAAELTSPAIAARALLHIYAKAPHIEREFWRAYFRQADEMPAPPAPPFEALAHFLKQSPLSRAGLQELLEQNLAAETHETDTHPALKDRVKKLTDTLELPAPCDTNAAEIWLGNRYGEVLHHFDHAWLEANIPVWQQRFRHVQKAKSLLTRFADTDPASLSDLQLWEFAQATYEFGSDAAALPLYEQFQRRRAQSTGAAYFIGRILAKRRDAAALPQFKIALGNPATVQDAARRGYELLRGIGRHREAELWCEEVARIEAAQHAAGRESVVGNTADSPARHRSLHEQTHGSSGRPT